MTAPIQPTIFQAIARVLADLPAIGKNQRNRQQGYAFRGIDDVLDALNPLLAKHGVFFVPEVLERLETSRETKGGGTLWVVNLHVRYTFYGPLGDSVVASGWGEGTDSGDKATQKAMTGAMKYVLFQTFAIATNEQAEADSDHQTPEPTTRRMSSGPPTSASSRASGGSEPSEGAGPDEEAQRAGPRTSDPAPSSSGPPASATPHRSEPRGPEPPVTVPSSVTAAEPEDRPPTATSGSAPDRPAPKERIAELTMRVEKLKLGDWVKAQHYAWPWDDDVCDVIEARCNLTVSAA